MLSKFLELSSTKYPHLNVTFSYGTAGVRTLAAHLTTAMFRLGCVAALRSKSLNGQHVGCMITASHNPECDNGAKIVDPLGNMLEQGWEPAAAGFLNAGDLALAESLRDLVDRFEVDFSKPGRVVVGCDTRESSPALLEALVDGVKSLDCEAVVIGTVTTPQLHYVVRCTNDPAYGLPSIDGYYAKLAEAFNNLSSGHATTKYQNKIVVDAANGVGAEKLQWMADRISGLEVDLVNRGEGQLNHECGADFVKISQAPPAGMEMEALGKYASLDGDADRLIYFSKGQSGEFRMLDGDRIATLFAVFLQKLVNDCGLEGMRMAIVQTAYANGMSTIFIREKLGIEAKCVPTGVKFLHHEAQGADIGIYFEANGHGTICFSDKLKEALRVMDSVSAKRFRDFVDLTNEAVGDAIADLLLVEVVLRHLDMSIDDWFGEYEELPCRQLKVVVKDRTLIETTNAERTCVKPEGLQKAVDEAVAKYENGRSFVRPSGTENIVRVYAEAKGLENAEKLAREVVAIVEKFLA